MQQLHALRAGRPHPQHMLLPRAVPVVAERLICGQTGAGQQQRQFVCVWGGGIITAPVWRGLHVRVRGGGEDAAPASPGCANILQGYFAGFTRGTMGAHHIWKFYKDLQGGIQRLKEAA